MRIVHRNGLAYTWVPVKELENCDDIFDYKGAEYALFYELYNGSNEIVGNVCLLLWENDQKLITRGIAIYNKLDEYKPEIGFKMAMKRGLKVFRQHERHGYWSDAILPIWRQEALDIIKEEQTGVCSGEYKAVLNPVPTDYEQAILKDFNTTQAGIVQLEEQVAASH